MKGPIQKTTEGLMAPGAKVYKKVSELAEELDGMVFGAETGDQAPATEPDFVTTTPPVEENVMVEPLLEPQVGAGVATAPTVGPTPASFLPPASGATALGGPACYTPADMKLAHRDWSLAHRLTEVGQREQRVAAREHELDDRERDLGDRERRFSRLLDDEARRNPSTWTSGRVALVVGVGGLSLATGVLLARWAWRSSAPEPKVVVVKAGKKTKRKKSAA